MNHSDEQQAERSLISGVAAGRRVQKNKNLTETSLNQSPTIQSSVTQSSVTQSPVTQADFRRAVGSFTTGICVVTTFLGEHDHAMTANAFTSVSLDPPLVLVCVEHKARVHDAVIDSGVWGVSVLDESAEEISRWFATRGRPIDGELNQTAHHRAPITAVAWLDQSLAWLECVTTAVHLAGDHSIVVGEVVSVKTAAAVGDEPANPLLYLNGKYRKL